MQEKKKRLEYLSLLSKKNQKKTSVFYLCPNWQLLKLPTSCAPKRCLTFVLFFFFGGKVKKQKQGPKWGLRCACAKAKRLSCRLYQNKGPGQAKGFYPTQKPLQYWDYSG
jgi:hypothetical protein